MSYDFTGVTVGAGTTVRDINVSGIPPKLFIVAALRGLKLIADEQRMTDPATPAIPDAPDMEEEGDVLTLTVNGSQIMGTDGEGTALSTISGADVE